VDEPFVKEPSVDKASAGERSVAAHFADNPSLQAYTLNELQAFTCATLQAQGEENPAAAARLLLCGLLDLSATELALKAPELLSPDAVQRVKAALQRRCAGEPLQYIVGRAAFRHLEYIVRPGVLIPRPETEVLVDKVKTALENMMVTQPQILDIGTGSGCIALALLDECPHSEVTATDNSAEALCVAQENAELHGAVCATKGAKDRLHLLHCDLASALLDKADKLHSFHAVVSNPPYIPSATLHKLPHEVTQYEPPNALDGGADGLVLFRRIATQAAVLLAPQGFFACELFETTLTKAADYLAGAGCWKDIHIHTDLADRPRVLTASLEEALL
jgi:release factor glutamine methyltransferase